MISKEEFIATYGQGIPVYTYKKEVWYTSGEVYYCYGFRNNNLDLFRVGITSNKSTDNCIDLMLLTNDDIIEYGINSNGDYYKKPYTERVIRLRIDPTDMIKRFIFKYEEAANKYLNDKSRCKNVNDLALFDIDKHKGLSINFRNANVTSGDKPFNINDPLDSNAFKLIEDKLKIKTDSYSYCKFDDCECLLLDAKTIDKKFVLIKSNGLVFKLNSIDEVKLV